MAQQRKPVVVITGASKGIGLAVTKILLEDFNAIVVALSRTRTPELLDLLNRHQSTLMTFEADVTDKSSVTNAINLASKVFQGIDSLILNAGTLEPMGRIDSPSTTADSWRKHFDVNFFSMIDMLQVVLPNLRASSKGGRIVFVSSGAALGSTPGWGAYNASKAAMNSLCRTLSQEEPGIVSVALRPGQVDTGMQALLRSEGSAHMSEADYQRFVAAHAEGKLVNPEDPGYVIAALSLQASNELSGQFVTWNADECKGYRHV
ncbi:short-chain dehydrogenase [Rickenella mellea]|uniref:Short-chain dehydrogenase n=1 Tax=Rickenella mellea TaxID=50990 RepID=A0A4R5XH60_9AGAM|nr:short-chain dehydrogenase [Rickenella mellea]